MDDKTIIENKSKFVLVHSSSGFKHSLKGELDPVKLSMCAENSLAFIYMDLYIARRIRECDPSAICLTSRGMSHKSKF